MSKRDNIIDLVTLCIGDEFPAEPVAELRFYTWRIDEVARRVDFGAYFQRPPSDTTKEPFWEVEGILSTHLDDDWIAHTRFLDTNEGEHPGPQDQLWFPTALPRDPRDNPVSASLVRRCIEAFWPRDASARVLAFSFLLQQEARMIWLKALVERPLTRDEWDEVDCIAADLQAQLSDDWRVETLFGCDPRGPFFFAGDTVVFCREDLVGPEGPGLAGCAPDELAGRVAARPRAALLPYLAMVEDFLGGIIADSEISRLFQGHFLRSEFPYGHEGPEFQAVNEFFLDCENYVENPALHGPDDFDETELRSRALRAQARLRVLIEGAS